MGAFLADIHFLPFIYGLNTLLALYLIFADRKDATTTMAWIMILYLIPGFGLLLYLILSQNLSRRKLFKVSPDEESKQDFLMAYQVESMDEDEFFYPNEITRKWSSMIRLNQIYAKSFLTTNNDVELLTDGRQQFHRMMQDIRHAKKRIHVCYFIIKNDGVGTKFIDLLTKKAEEGVEVRLLMDALGSKQITAAKLRRFKQAGGQYAFFFKPFIRHLYFRINYRNHRKIVVIDDEIGYTGGFNVAREYLGYKKKFGYWRDSHLRICGDAVISLNKRFMLDWRYASSDMADYDPFAEAAEATVDNEDGTVPIQIVSCGPESPKQEVKQAFMKMITSAEKRIYIQTPYFVPDRPVLETLIMAAQSGIDVRVMIPCMPDHPFVYRTTLYNAGELIQAGVKIYIYEHGFLHAKTLTVDGEVSTVGSTNFDIRSFRLNFETNAFLYDRRFAAAMEEQFHRDMLLSREYTAEDREHISAKEYILESISRLLTEIL